MSSSRAQALLNDYFSGEVVRELVTVLLVDEVIYNIYIYCNLI